MTIATCCLAEGSIATAGWPQRSHLLSAQTGRSRSGGHLLLEEHEHGPGSGIENLAIPELHRNTIELSRELPTSAGELNYPVSLIQSGLAVRLTLRPRQRGQHHPPTGGSLDASTSSSSSGTSMSISSNSKLKAAYTWAGQTRPAVALFSRPTRISSSRSAMVIFGRR